MCNELLTLYLASSWLPADKAHNVVHNMAATRTGLNREEAAMPQVLLYSVYSFVLKASVQELFSLSSAGLTIQIDSTHKWDHLT